jgi:hypothetical protein
MLESARATPTDLVAIDVTRLFKPALTSMVVRDDMHLRGYMLDFIRMIAAGASGLHSVSNRRS